jgi:hypothetical protein
MFQREADLNEALGYVYALFNLCSDPTSIVRLHTLHFANSVSLKIEVERLGWMRNKHTQLASKDLFAHLDFIDFQINLKY